MKISIDYREKKRSKKGLDFYSDRGHEVDIVTLDSGDFVFEDRVAFEYKTYSDAFASIKDGRLFDESIRQSEWYPYHFVIIVGSDKDRQNASYKLYRQGVKFRMKQYYGAVARLNTYTNVIFAPNMVKAFKIMECQAEKCLDSKPIVRDLSNKTVNVCTNILMMFPHVKFKRAELITDSLKLETVEDLMNVEYSDLTGIKGIGDVSAKNIMDNLKKKGLKKE